MSPNLKEQLVVEIKQVRAQMDAQKQLIRRNIGNTVVVEAAEQQLKELHTRMAVLETNHQKMISQPAASD